MYVTLCGSGELVDVPIWFPRAEVKWYLSICVDVTLACVWTKDDDPRWKTLEISWLLVRTVIKVLEVWPCGGSTAPGPLIPTRACPFRGSEGLCLSSLWALELQVTMVSIDASLPVILFLQFLAAFSVCLFAMRDASYTSWVESIPSNSKCKGDAFFHFLTTGLSVG